MGGFFLIICKCLRDDARRMLFVVMLPNCDIAAVARLGFANWDTTGVVLWLLL